MQGIITLAAAAAIQAGYTIYCLASKSRQTTVNHALRFSALALLSLMLCLGVYEWSFRWAPLFILLSVFSLVSVINIISQKMRPKERRFHMVWTILTGIGGVIMFTAALLPAIIFPQYRAPATTGLYEVATAQYTYVDTSRVETYSSAGENREVNVALWYPKNASGELPLVVFSHGFCGIKNSNYSTFLELASHGYVVCSIDHPYHSLYTENEQGKLTVIDMGYMNEYAAQGDDKVENLRLYQKWMDIRVADINFVIDTILSGNNEVYQLVDHTKIGVFGHSLGGAAAMGVPRTRQDIDAVINLDAPMLCELTGVENGVYTINPEPYPTPLLNIYSQYLYDNGILADDELYFENRLVSATAPVSYEVVFKGSQHMNLTDLALISPVLANILDSGRKADINKYYCIETMNSIVLEFFDCYLKGSGSFNSAGIY